MKTSKILVMILITLGIVGLVMFNWIVYWSPSAKEAWLNVENSKKLQVGMTKEDMLNIMVEPFKVLPDSTYIYHPPFAASSGIDILIKGDTIAKIRHYEAT